MVSPMAVHTTGILTPQRPYHGARTSKPTDREHMSLTLLDADEHVSHTPSSIERHSACQCYAARVGLVQPHKWS